MRINGGPLRVLIVDDEPLIRFTLSIIFMKNAEVKTVESAEEALGEIWSQQYDLCFLDYNLPGMTGLDALKIMNERSKKTKVVIMTGSYFDEDMMRQVEENAYAFIEKPFEMSHILELAKNIEATLTERSDKADAKSSKHPKTSSQRPGTECILL